MAWEDDDFLDIDRNYEDDISDKEYSDILGLEDTLVGGEGQFDEDEIEDEITEEEIIIVENEKEEKKKRSYRKYVTPVDDMATEQQNGVPNQTESRKGSTAGITNLVSEHIQSIQAEGANYSASPDNMSSASSSQISETVLSNQNSTIVPQYENTAPEVDVSVKNTETQTTDSYGQVEEYSKQDNITNNSNNNVAYHQESIITEDITVALSEPNTPAQNVNTYVQENSANEQSAIVQQNGVVIEGTQPITQSNSFIENNTSQMADSQQTNKYSQNSIFNKDDGIYQTNETDVTTIYPMDERNITQQNNDTVVQASINDGQIANNQQEILNRNETRVDSASAPSEGGYVGSNIEFEEKRTETQNTTNIPMSNENRNTFQTNGIESVSYVNTESSYSTQADSVKHQNNVTETTNHEAKENIFSQTEQSSKECPVYTNEVVTPQTSGKTVEYTANVERKTTLNLEQDVKSSNAFEETTSVPGYKSSLETDKSSTVLKNENLQSEAISHQSVEDVILKKDGAFETVIKPEMTNGSNVTQVHPSEKTLPKVDESREIPLPLEYKSSNKIKGHSEMVSEIASGTTESKSKALNIPEKSRDEMQIKGQKEQGSIDVKASEQGREDKAETARKFKSSVDIERTALNVYEHGKSAIKALMDDDVITEGKQEIDKYTKPVSLSMAMFAAGSTVSNIKQEMIKTEKAVAKAIDLVESGKITLSDLSSGSKKELKNKLSELELSKGDIARIVKNKGDAYDFIVVRSAIKDIDLAHQLLPDNLKEHLNSPEFFNLRSKDTNSLLSFYFKNSNNEVLKNTNVIGLSLKDLKRLEKSAKKNGFSAHDLAAIRLAKKQAKLKRAKILSGMEKTKAFLRLVSKLSDLAKDELLQDGVRNISISMKTGSAGYSIVKIGIKGGRLAGHYISKIPPVHWVESQIARGAKFVGRKFIQVAKLTGQVATMPIRLVSSAVKQGTTKVVNKVIPKQTIANIRKVQQKANQAKAAVKQTVKTGKKVASKSAKAVGKGVRTVTKPARFIGGGFAKFFGAINKVKVAIAIAGVSVAAVYMLFVAIMAMIISIGGSAGEGIATTILSNDNQLVYKMVETLSDKIDAREQEAISLTETVQNPSVMGGRTISRYGYKQADGTWTDGYTIKHVDENGIQIASGANNSKDVIIITYLLMLADFDSYPTQRDNLLTDMWDAMNPDCTYKETDIYTCTTGCETVYYVCNDSATLTGTGHTYESASAMNGYKNEGVFFKSTVKSSTTGDSYKTVCQGHDHGTKTTTVSVPSGCDNYAVSVNGTTYTVSCKGHTSNHGSKTTSGHPEAPSGCNNYSTSYSNGKFTCICKGHTTTHTSTTGTVNIPSGCDNYESSISGTTCTVKCKKTGGSSHNHGTKTGTGTATAPKSGCNNYTTEYFCTGHSVNACFGHKDIKITVTTLFMEYIFNNDYVPNNSNSANYNSYSSRINAFKANADAWQNGWTSGYEEWASSLYNENWNNLYGVDPLGGISVCPQFTETEILEILSSVGLSDSSASNYKACKFALSKVGYPYDQNLRDSGTAYDCSSLCYYAWLYAGKNLAYEGLNTAAQEAKGLVNNGIMVFDSTAIGSSYSQNALKPGDLIFYSYENNDRYLDISHVAMYIGNGMAVEARGKAYGVVYRPVPNTHKIVLVCRPK